MIDQIKLDAKVETPQSGKRPVKHTGTKLFKHHESLTPWRVLLEDPITYNLIPAHAMLLCAITEKRFSLRSMMRKTTVDREK